jgi:cephalosporin hydroxylase
MTAPIRDDSHSDYHAIKSRANASVRNGVWIDRFPERFVPFASREMRCDMPKEAIRAISEGKHYITYHGLPMAKDPFDIVLYEMLFFELKPRTIIELGAYTGASAMWMAQTLRLLNIDARVIAVDIDLSLVDELARKEPNIKFLQGDCHEIEKLFPAPVLQDLPRPLILIDDVHVNISGVYRHFHSHGLQPGDYLIIEDTIPWIPGTFGKAGEGEEWGDWKWQEIKTFFAENSADYRVDRYFTDFFGYNGTWNWNGFVKRMR